MEKARILEQLIKEQGYSLKAFAAKCDIPYTTLYGIMKNGVGRASVDNVIQICKTLCITIEDLESMANGEPAIPEPSYESVEQLLARNGKVFSTEQKLRLIKLLSEIN
ncbi:helix-turn-helix domain-containing protein [Lachnoclostridium phocaeense]|uniref:helix-turn-helix domain-containing protein n=1 Tax=Lachnoclostridium phocaeense TaxID=1871021 RepID=UPI00248F2801|nr:helix-turn-helix domain-containing protein [Lachnoclostridium phocaeense]